MTETENGESTAGGGEEQGAGHTRLEGELTAFRAEFESLAEEVATDAETETPEWVARGRTLLDRAESALGAGDIEQGWHYLHAAKRLRLYGLEATEGAATRQGEAREILVEANHASLAWRATAVQDRLATAGGTLREDLTWDDVRAARALLDEGYQRIHLKRQHLQSQFTSLMWGAGITVGAFLLVTLASVFLGVLPSPLFTFSSGGTAEPAGFFIYVVLGGMLGASLFGLRSLRNRPTSASTPQYLTPRRASVARILVGAGSALAVVLFLRSGWMTIGGDANASRGAFLVAAAFAAGYSERFVHRTVESVASVTEAETGESGES